MAEFADNHNADISTLYSKLEESKSRLKNLDNDITKLTGRDPSENRSAYIEKRRSMYDNGNYIANSLGNKPNRRSSDDSRHGFDRLNRPRDNRPNLNNKPRELKRPYDNDVITPTRSKSGVSSSIVVKEEEIFSRNDELNKEAKKTSDDTKTRNKRMFGFLMGTLNQFKKDENQSETKKEMRMKVEKRVEERAIEAKKEEKSERIELFSRRKEEKKKLFDVQHQVEIAEMHESWDNGKKALMPFIKTRYNPSIFYKPLHISSNNRLKELLQKSVSRIEGEIVSRREIFDNTLKTADEKINFTKDKLETDKIKIQRGNERKRHDFDKNIEKNAHLDKSKSSFKENENRSKQIKSEVVKKRSHSRSPSHSIRNKISNGNLKKEQSTNNDEPIEKVTKRENHRDIRNNDRKLSENVKNRNSRDKKSKSSSSSSSSGSSDSSSDSNSESEYSTSSSEGSPSKRRK